MLVGGKYEAGDPVQCSVFVSVSSVRAMIGERSGSFVNRVIYSSHSVYM